MLTLLHAEICQICYAFVVSISIFFQLLYATPLFRGLNLEQLQDVSKRLKISNRQKEKGEVLLHQGEPLNDLVIIVKGRAKAETASKDGKHFTVEVLEAPEMVASSILFAEENYMPVTLTAIEPCLLARIPKTLLLALFQDYPEMLKSLLRDMGNRTVFLARKLRMSLLFTLRQRIAQLLLELGERAGMENPILLPFSKQGMADILGVARPSLVRVLTEMQEAGLFACERRTLRILNAERLIAIAAKGSF